MDENNNQNKTLLTASPPNPTIEIQPATSSTIEQPTSRSRARKHLEVTVPLNAKAHAFFRDHFAVPTPLDSPAFDFRESEKHRLGHASHHHHHCRGRANAATEHGGENGAVHGCKCGFGWRYRSQYFQWSWFCMIMATGQLANVLAAIPFQFSGLYYIGVVLVLFNIALFILCVVMISIRFHTYPKSFWDSLTHPTESLSVPAGLISLATILGNITVYGTIPGKTGHWLTSTMIVLFWIYCGLALLCVCTIYLIMWSTQTFTLSRMTPLWIFPAYPLLVVAPQAAVLSSRPMDPTTALNIILTGFTLQAIGFMVSFMVYSAFLYRLMTNKLPTEASRPAMFISVGTSGFTVAGLVGLAAQIPKVAPKDFMGDAVGSIAGLVTVVLANWVGLWLWGLAVFFLLVSIGAHVSCMYNRKLGFAMTWYSFVFPNTGFAAGTFAIANAFDCYGLKVVGCIVTVGIVILWVIVSSLTIRAVHLKRLLWPEVHDESVGPDFVVGKSNTQIIERPRAGSGSDASDTTAKDE